MHRVRDRFEACVAYSGAHAEGDAISPASAEVEAEAEAEAEALALAARSPFRSAERAVSSAAVRRAEM